MLGGLSMIGKAIRMRRIFKEDHKTVISALDFGAFAGTVKGIEKPRAIVEQVIKGGADALIMTPGFARATYDLFAGKAGLIMRVTGGCSTVSKSDGLHTLTASVAEANMLGADAVCNMIFVGHEREPRMFEIMQQLREDCLRYGLVLVAELLPADFSNSYDHDLIDLCVRLGYEHGADVIKTYYTPKNYHEIVSNCPVPVVMAGGPKDCGIYDSVTKAMRDGASGVAIGRNIFQSDDPAKTVADIVKIVHGEGLSL